MFIGIPLLVAFLGTNKMSEPLVEFWGIKFSFYVCQKVPWLVALGKCAANAATSLFSCCSTPSFVLTKLLPGPVSVRIHALRQVSSHGLQNLGEGGCL